MSETRLIQSDVVIRSSETSASEVLWKHFIIQVKLMENATQQCTTSLCVLHNDILNQEHSIFFPLKLYATIRSKFCFQHWKVPKGKDTQKLPETIHRAIEELNITTRGSVRSTRGLGLTMTAWGQSIGISIGMLPQTLIMSITVQKTSKYYTTEFDFEEGF